MKRAWVAFLMMLVCAAPAAAQDPNDPDMEGCKDSKFLTRMPGCQLYECSAKEFDAVEIIVGAVNKDTGESPTKTLEGATEYYHYVCPAKYSQLQIFRNLESALKKGGFNVITSGKNQDDAYLVTANKGAQWLELRLWNFNEYPTYKLNAVLVQGMEQEVTADASSLAAEISKSGSVAVYGINFDTGKATLQAGSEAVLEEVAKLMKEQPDWRLEVQGHTDNVGAKAANQTLSQQRAAAVVGWLTKNGIEASRLVAKGYGDTAPVADNSTDEGRAKNRRVELKKLNGQ